MYTISSINSLKNSANTLKINEFKKIEKNNGGLFNKYFYELIE